jgi:hypothetical protein
VAIFSQSFYCRGASEPRFLRKLRRLARAAPLNKARLLLSRVGRLRLQPLCSCLSAPKGVHFCAAHSARSSPWPGAPCVRSRAVPHPNRFAPISPPKSFPRVVPCSPNTRSTLSAVAAEIEYALELKAAHALFARDMRNHATSHLRSGYRCSMCSWTSICWENGNVD